jgi:S-formylglutathione hydrolase FrmB
MQKIILIFLIQFVFIKNTIAANVDTVEIYSQSMRKAIKCVVIVPNASKETKYPVVYLLHGYSGKYSNWIIKVPIIKKYADELGIIIVCPDGGFSSWYLDSPLDPTYQYETFLTKELVTYIDRNYKTIAATKARAITGLSMGGHGGIYVGLKHQQIFGAIGSMSGALDVTYIKGKYQLEKRLGDSILNVANYNSHSTYAMIDTITTNQKIIVDCGTEDFVLPFNEEIHKRFMKRKIKHEYILRPGKHDWDYWANAVYFQLVFFNKFFDEEV